MPAIDLEDNESAKFEQMTVDAPIRNGSGRTVGYFIPKADYERRRREWVEARLTDEEVRRLSGEPGRYTTDEVLRYLRGL